jgi:hypothetical protein
VIFRVYVNLPEGKGFIGFDAVFFGSIWLNGNLFSK